MFKPAAREQDLIFHILGREWELRGVFARRGALFNFAASALSRATPGRDARGAPQPEGRARGRGGSRRPRTSLRGRGRKVRPRRALGPAPSTSLRPHLAVGWVGVVSRADSSAEVQGGRDRETRLDPSALWSP